MALYNMDDPTWRLMAAVLLIQEQHQNCTIIGVRFADTSGWNFEYQLLHDGIKFNPVLHANLNWYTAKLHGRKVEMLLRSIAMGITK